MKSKRMWVWGVVIGSGMMGGAARTQYTPTVPTTVPSAAQSANPMDRNKKEDSPFGDAVEKQVKQRNDERQRRLVSDTEKLLALATSLHDDVAKTDKNVLSLDVVRRADEIERLAHSIKERMKG